ncbi:MAG: hypothetical protein ACOYLS_10425 [Polymorphobacter sp.]
MASPKAETSTRAAAVSRLAAPIWLVLVSLILALGLGYWVASTAPDFETLALGDATKSVYGRYDGDKIFCGTPAEAPECLGPAKARALPHQLLWLGNSQLHAINQPAPSDETAPVLLARSQRPRGVEVQAMSFPNASFAEFYLAYLLQKQQRRIDVLVVPLFLDDTREGKVRDILQPVALTPAINTVLRAVPAGRHILGELPKAETDATGAAAKDTSLQARSEAAITAALEACCGFQTMREQARGQIEIQAYGLRNTIFGVTAQSIRPIIADSYDANMAALDAMFADAAAAGTHIIAYIPPIRQDVTTPYAPADYARFKAETRALAARHGAEFIDIDAIVPGPLWGTKASTNLGGAPELDFMHFQEPGHIAVAARIRPLVEAATGAAK